MVELHRRSGRSVRQIALENDLTESALASWIRQADTSPPQSADAPPVVCTLEVPLLRGTSEPFDKPRIPCRTGTSAHSDHVSATLDQIVTATPGLDSSLMDQPIHIRGQ
jgi:hypothetical protein